MTVNREEFELLHSAGFDFQIQKSMLPQDGIIATVKIASTANHGITHLQVPETMVPSFAQAKLCLVLDYLSRCTLVMEQLRI